MMKKLGTVSALIFSAVLALAAVDGWAAGGDKLTGRLSFLSAGEEARVIIRLDGQVDPVSVTAGVRGRDKALRTRLLVKTLKDNWSATGANLSVRLAELKGQGKVKDVKELWLVNGFALSAPREVLDEIADLPEVLEIYPDEKIMLETPVPMAGPAEDNLGVINATTLWDMGFTGQGMVVAGFDSGVDVQHPDLAGSYRGGANSWYDPNGEHATPFDADGHGTETMGVMVGGSAGGTAIGVAPGAQWIAVKMFDDSGGAWNSNIHLGYQWLLDPDGNPATDDAPDVVNNSWGFDAPGFCYTEFEPDIAALRSAGIVPVYAAGNYGPISETGISPANNQGALSVGATDDFDNPTSFSSRGPNTCNGAIFPLLAAPGLGIRTSAISNGGQLLYVNVNGTSFAAPHVAGAVALLLSATPGLTVDQIETALVAGAYDLSPEGPDNDTGFGRLDVLASYGMLADSSSAYITLDGPDDAALLYKRTTHTFSWQYFACYGFEVQFSQTPDFAIMNSLTPPAYGPTTEYTPDWRSWKRYIRKLSRRGSTVYWRVKGTAPNGDTVYSDTRTFSVVKVLPVP